MCVPSVGPLRSTPTLDAFAHSPARATLLSTATPPGILQAKKLTRPDKAKTQDAGHRLGGEAAAGVYAGGLGVGWRRLSVFWGV